MHPDVCTNVFNRGNLYFVAGILQYRIRLVISDHKSSLSSKPHQWPSVASLSQKLYPNWLVFAGPRNGFKSESISCKASITIKQNECVKTNQLQTLSTSGPGIVKSLEIKYGLC